ncbi:anti-sigma factor [Pseudonocardia sp.]|jgi:hypothetical protein|uniref:anti-sigma factor n=1 Tax=Pseudonocardia sp. TaxID=60912 RepID=UPI0031FBD07C
MSDAREETCPLNEQTVGWALHALEPDEEMAVVQHLPQCPSCQDSARDVEQVMAALGSTAEQVDPPPSLRSALMASVAETPQHPRSQEARPSNEPEWVPAQSAPRHRASDDAPARGSRPPTSPHRSWLSRRRRKILAASLALVALLIVGGLAVRSGQLEQQRNTEMAQAQNLADLVRELDRPGARHALLNTQDGSTVAAVLVADGQRQVFTVGMPPNAANRDTYVLWGVHAGADPQPLGTFDVSAADPGRHTVGSGAEADGFTAYAISLEPGRTAPASPSSVMAQGQVEI